MSSARALAIGVLLAALPAVGGVCSAARAATPAHAAAGFALPWIADDYTKAVAEARARRVPLFIEAWAPW
jgi:hypothetical protein